MKTMISIGDEVFAAAEELAEELGMNRSELYTRAVAEYVARRRGENVTRQLNEVYAKVEARLDPELDALQRSRQSRMR
jgi:predicted transcriptional regulator